MVTYNLGMWCGEALEAQIASLLEASDMATSGTMAFLP